MSIERIDETIAKLEDAQKAIADLRKQLYEARAGAENMGKALTAAIDNEDNLRRQLSADYSQRNDPEFWSAKCAELQAENQQLTAAIKLAKEALEPLKEQLVTHWEMSGANWRTRLALRRESMSYLEKLLFDSAVAVDVALAELEKG